VAQASGGLVELAGWLERREPGAVLDEIRGYARRKPGMFLLGAAALGVLAGRITRNLSEPNRRSGATGAGAADPARIRATPSAGYPAAVHPPAPSLSSDYRGTGAAAASGEYAGVGGRGDATRTDGRIGEGGPR